MASIDRSLSEARTEGCQLGKKGKTEALKVAGSQEDGAQYDGTRVAAGNRTDTCVLRAAVENESPEDESKKKQEEADSFSDAERMYHQLSDAEWMDHQLRLVHEDIPPP